MVFKKSEILKNAVSERWCADSSFIIPIIFHNNTCSGAGKLDAGKPEFMIAGSVRHIHSMILPALTFAIFRVLSRTILQS